MKKRLKLSLLRLRLRLASEAGAAGPQYYPTASTSPQGSTSAINGSEQWTLTNIKNPRLSHIELDWVWRSRMTYRPSDRQRPLRRASSGQLNSTTANHSNTLHAQANLTAYKYQVLRISPRKAANQKDVFEQLHLQLQQLLLLFIQYQRPDERLAPSGTLTDGPLRHDRAQCLPERRGTYLSRDSTVRYKRTTCG